LQLFNYLIASVISIAGKPHHYAESIYIENPQKDGRKAIQNQTEPGQLRQAFEGIIQSSLLYLVKLNLYYYQLIIY
jgi:hypothetical protein